MIQSWLSRYGRRRRLVAATLAAIAVISAYIATRPSPPPTTVLVATRDLPPGPLTPSDLRPVPLNHPPDGAVRTTTAAAGRYLTSPMRRGEPLTDARLLDSYRLPPGMVATPVRISDPAAARLLSPGSRINVLAAWEEAHPARTIAEDVSVITAAAQRQADENSSNSNGTLIVLATTSTQAAELAAAQAHARLSITIIADSGSP
ncbi:Flp pilus assembly protein CpaB [Nonomuraea polychroma]|uniref:Flp pilus assembly protein CpaB n=1 Tax=Nonomuraea polychroma TaxID=46176 RepID=A0A438MGD3_9ACTN|nr:Flp pilus assembly protein CpaB [Nonomuraea polychroma]RVX44899.1 Flp pilus assembly protein CpaB [Nonomuraea polychroma]